MFEAKIGKIASYFLLHFSHQVQKWQIAILKVEFVQD